jgi:NAD(P)-dependent dehydrogenase (short-subunit alcohol dehydrogenase family)
VVLYGAWKAPRRYCHCNVAHKAEVDAALAATLARFGHVDGLVNNAGIFKAATSWTSPKPTGTR